MNLDNYTQNNMLSGMDIKVCPTNIVPKIKLGEADPVSDEFQTEFDAWMLEMFGTRDLSILPRWQVYVFGRTVVMRPEDFCRLQMYSGA